MKKPRGHIQTTIEESDLYLSKKWWTPSQMAQEIGADPGSLKNAISVLDAAGKIESNSNGCYRKTAHISTSSMPIRTRYFDFEKKKFGCWRWV